MLPIFLAEEEQRWPLDYSVTLKQKFGRRRNVSRNFKTQWLAEFQPTPARSTSTRWGQPLLKEKHGASAEVVLPLPAVLVLSLDALYGNIFIANAAAGHRQRGRNPLCFSFAYPFGHVYSSRDFYLCCDVASVYSVAATL
jgi:hypothetical protein